MDHICPNCGNLLACGYFRGLHVIGCAFCGLRGPGAPLDAPHPQAAIALFSRFFGWKMKRDPLANHCVCGGKHKRG